MVEHLVTLKMSAVSIAPGATTYIVNVAGVADRQDKDSGLNVMELLDVSSKDINHGVTDARQDDAFDIAVLSGTRDLVLKPSG